MPKTSKQSFSLSITHLVILFGISALLLIISLFSKSLSHLKIESTVKLSPSPGVTSSPSPSPEFVGRSVKVPILTYHYIGNNPNPADKARDNLLVPPDKFEEQMNYLSTNGYNTISFDTMYAGLKGISPLPPKPIILTFDDGYIDFYINAFPILRRYNLHAVSFIPTGLIGGGYYMNWSQIKEIDATGLVSFEAHSIHHPSLPGLSDAELNSELLESKKTLEAELGKPVNFMAYPYGSSDGRVQQAAKGAGFLGSTGTWSGRVETEGNIYNMPRTKVDGSWKIEQFASYLGL